jgi:hypothetical protein
MLSESVITKVISPFHSANYFSPSLIVRPLSGISIDRHSGRSESPSGAILLVEFIRLSPSENEKLEYSSATELFSVLFADDINLKSE